MTRSQSVVLPTDVVAFLAETGLCTGGVPTVGAQLSGGVSSRLWRIQLPVGPILVKGALARLKVAGDWRAPMSRNTVEWNWLRYAHGAVPGSTPTPLAHDPRCGLIAMQYLPSSDYPLWKDLLLAGDVRAADARGVGEVLGRLHAASAGVPEYVQQFATDTNFTALRIHPYFHTTAARHPDLRNTFDALIERTMNSRHAVVHGDVSPKNILLGGCGPVLLDAECAWYGDPAFDLAFVLTHLLLKTVIVTGRRHDLLHATQELIDSYLPHVTWEARDALDGRAAALVPALLLARVDGMSPVEYLNPAQQRSVRRGARLLLQPPQSDLCTVIHSAAREINRT